MYDSGEGLRPDADADSTYRRAITRVGKLLGDCLPGMSADVVRLRSALQPVQADPIGEHERQLALGWLAWLAGDWPAAADLLASGGREPPVGAPEQGAHAPRSPLLDPAWTPYWRGRVGLLLDKPTALTEYEAALKRLGGSPQAIAWYVDLLERAGRPDRAEQVWKSVRSNKRVAGRDEGPLLEARWALRKGEYANGERLLREASPGNGVVQVERQLLLAWALVGLGKADQAREALARAAEGPYPSRAIDEWRILVEARLRGESVPGVSLSPGWRIYLDGQEARAVGRLEEAISHYRAALAAPAVQPFAGHALACLGEGPPPSAMPGLFFSVRGRALQAAEKYSRRESTPGELLEALDQAARAGVEVDAFADYRRLAVHRKEREVDLSTFADADPVLKRNALRLALESVDGLAPERQKAVLIDWAKSDLPDDLRSAAGRQLLRLALGRRDRSLLESARAHLPRQELATADALFADGLDRESLEKLLQRSSEGVYPALWQAVQLVVAAGRADLVRVGALLDDVHLWRTFRAGPPGFVSAALAALAAAKPTHAVWRKSLPPWLALWPIQALGESGPLLLSVAGVSAGPAPAGVEPEAWFRHQAARALLRDDASAALTFARQAASGTRDGGGWCAILPAMERRADAARLARCLGYAQPGLLADFIDLLYGESAGQSILGAAERGESTAVQNQLAALGERGELPGRLYHHLAVVESRLAEQAGDPLLGTLHARRAWCAWLSFLGGEGPTSEARALLLDHLLAGHRARVNDHLSRDELGPARSHWQLVRQLPALARQRAPALEEDLAGRVERFRDELATEYLLTTRDAMRFGDIPEGFRSNYERGLTLLQRPLALDGDNVRLLTAYTETCVDWFFDLYQLHDQRLFAEVDRLLKPAEHLAELVHDKEGEVAARSALAEYWKFRGFAAGDKATKAGLYRESLRLNPGNDNVRELLARLEGDHEE